ncbi:hypothetical protein DRO61_06390 [Candidatus Bathyarchaeota archaeon]|nr:MAG: hypothetical protein DRO61_06390 [Candidatus Bathyarchaeota archaeon]
MPARKVKIEVTADDGNKLTVVFEGKINRNKLLQVLDFVELLGGMPELVEDKTFNSLSKFDKLHNIVNSKFPIGWFTSQEIMISYEDTFSEPIGLSTVSTYLSRLTRRGFLVRSGSFVERRYKLRRVIQQENSPTNA